MAELVSGAWIHRVVQGKTDLDRDLIVRRLPALDLTTGFENFEPSKIFEIFRWDFRVVCLRGGFHKSASLFAMTKMQAVVSSD